MREELQQKLKVYLKERDRVRADTVRSIISAIQYEEMAKKVDSLDRDTTVSILQRELKKRKEELEFAEKSGRTELVESNKIETEVIESLLPKQMDSETLTNTISALRDELQAKNMGVVMKALQERFAGQYDGRSASEIAKKLFS